MRLASKFEEALNGINSRQILKIKNKFLTSKISSNFVLRKQQIFFELHLKKISIKDWPAEQKYAVANILLLCVRIHEDCINSQ
jgi:hypothetical protein